MVFHFYWKLASSAKWRKRSLGGKYCWTLGNFFVNFCYFHQRENFFSIQTEMGKPQNPPQIIYCLFCGRKSLVFLLPRISKNTILCFAPLFFLLQKAIIHVLLLLIHYFIRGGSFHLLLDFFSLSWHDEKKLQRFVMNGTHWEEIKILKTKNSSVAIK